MAHFSRSTINQRRPAHRNSPIDKATKRQMLAESEGFKSVEEWAAAGNSLPGEAKSQNVLNDKKFARETARAARAKLPEGVANERLPSLPESTLRQDQRSDVPEGMPVLLKKGDKPPRTLPHRADRAARFIGKNIAAAAADKSLDGLTSEADLNGPKKLQPKTEFQEVAKEVGLPKPVEKKPKKPKPKAAKKVALKSENHEKIPGSPERTE
jgi:hypothetical protein